MKTSLRPERILRRLAFAAGLAALLAALAASQTPGAQVRSKLDVSVELNSTGVLSAMPSGPVLEARGLRPGHPARAAVTVRNVAAVPLLLRPRAESPTRDLDRLLWLELRAGEGRPLFRGSLLRLRRAGGRTLRLAGGRERRLELVAWIPRSAPGGHMGRGNDVTLLLEDEDA